jgi:hypothetical protein
MPAEPSRTRVLAPVQPRHPRRRVSTLAAVAFAAVALCAFVGLAFVAGYIIGRLLL